MERIEGSLHGEGGAFFIPLEHQDAREVEGKQMAFFDEMSALLLAKELEEGAYALLNPGKPMPEEIGILNRPRPGKAGETPSLSERVLEVEQSILHMHRAFGREREELQAKIEKLKREVEAVRGTLEKL